MEIISKNTEETKQVAVDFAASLNVGIDQATIVCLSGELGAGKTTFMKYLAEYFGIKDTIQSPTFVIMKKYRIQNLVSGFEFLIHIDAYRLEDPSEMLKLGWQEMISDPKNLICIEWPEKIENIIPPHIVVRFDHVKDGESQRKISFA
jgi:tRNA threonylcarbamoyladenosine biosynthesis protein TsaE